MTSKPTLCGLTPQSVIRRCRFSAGVPCMSSFIDTLPFSSIYGRSVGRIHARSIIGLITDRFRHSAAHHGQLS